MLLKQKILYVVAGDALEPRTTAQIAEMSKALGAYVHLLAVVGKRTGLLPGGGAEAGARQRVEEVAERLRGLRARVGETLVLRGDIAVTAQEAADRMAADHIAIGAGEGALTDPAHLDKPVRALARSARPNLWICKPGTEPALQHLLCAFDGSRGAAEAVRTSIDLCRQFNARLQLLSVLRPPSAAMPAGTHAEREEAEAATRRAMQDRRLAFLEGFNFDGVKVARNLIWAPRASAPILGQASRHPDGLLVLGVAGQRRFATPGLGRTADRVVADCVSSLLLVK